MIYRCKRCEREIAFGCLPSVSCGLFLLALVGLESLTISVCMPPLQRHLFAGVAVRWWAWPLIVPLAIAGLIVGAIALNVALELVERLCVARRRCPSCGARRWSRGFTRGFGL